MTTTFRFDNRADITTTATTLTTATYSPPGTKANLQSVTVAEGVVSLGNGMFNGCTILTEITLPSTLANMGNNCFYGTTLLTSITIPPLVTVLKIGVFSHSGLTSLTIPDTVTSLLDDTITDADSCTELIFSGTSTIPIIPEDFARESGLLSIEIPASVTLIEKNAFWLAANLSEITFAEGSLLNKIDVAAFRYCISLTSFMVPATVTEFQNSVWRSCTSLTELTYVDASAVSLESSSTAFEGVPALTVHYYGVSPAQYSGLTSALQTQQGNMPGGSTFNYYTQVYTPPLPPLNDEIATMPLYSTRAAFTFYNNDTLPSWTTVGHNKKKTFIGNIDTTGGDGAARKILYMAELGAKLFGSSAAVDLLSNALTMENIWESTVNAGIASINATTANGNASKGVVDALITNAPDRFNLKYNASVTGGTTGTHAAKTATGSWSGATKAVTVVLADATTITSIDVD